MNILKIVFNDLKNFICQKKYIFCVLIIGLIVASYSLSFFTAQSLHIIDLIDTHFGYFTKYYIGGKKTIIDYEKFNSLNNWLKENNLENSKINIYSEMLLLNEEADHKDICVVVGTNNTNSKRIDFIGEKMTEEDLIQERDYILVEYYSHIVEQDVFLINKEIKIENKTYTVKAIDKIDINKNVYSDCNTKGHYMNDYESHLSAVAIPYTTFIKDEYNICAIEVIFEQPLSQEQKNSFNNLVNENFGIYSFVQPIKTDSNNISNIKDELIKYSIIILLALINIMALFNYWIDKNWRNYIIYKLCGAKNISIYFIITLEALIITIFTSFIGILLYYSTIPLLQKIYISYVLSLKELICIQSIIVFLVFFLININIIQLFRRNLRHIGRR